MLGTSRPPSVCSPCLSARRSPCCLCLAPRRPRSMEAPRVVRSVLAVLLPATRREWRPHDRFHVRPLERPAQLVHIAHNCRRTFSAPVIFTLGVIAIYLCYAARLLPPPAVLIQHKGKKKSPPFCGRLNIRLGSRLQRLYYHGFYFVSTAKG